MVWSKYSEYLVSSDFLIDYFGKKKKSSDY